MPQVSCWHSLKAFLAVVALLRPEHCSAQESESESQSVGYGRLHSLHPVTHCCTGESCITKGTLKRRHAVVTTLRSPEYMMGLRELKCTLEQTNPGVDLVILGAAGDFDPESPILEEIRQLGEYR